MPENAAQVAGDYLASIGFFLWGPGEWRGVIAGTPCIVIVPDEFPFVLPVVKVGPSPLKKVIAHVDAAGVVCIAPVAGVLLDSNNPLGLVRETLERAKRILVKKGETHNQRTIDEEYEAYWASHGPVWSLCRANGTSRKIKLGRFFSKSMKPRVLAADSEEELLNWTDTQELKNGGRTWSGLFVALSSSVPLHQYNWLSVGQFWKHVLSNSSAENRAVVEDWQRSNHKLPSWCIVSFPARNDEAFILVGAEIPRQEGLVGHRPSMLPFGTALKAAYGLQLKRRALVRLDGEYLRPRGGASNGYEAARVILVGAGAVGSFLAEYLLSSGVRELHIVDNDLLLPENTYRHLLGMKWVGWHKAEALKTHLKQMYPAESVTCDTRDAVEALDGVSFNEKTILVLVTGEHTLELRVSMALRSRTRIVHVWLEPAGLGHHVLVDGYSQSGCLRCLYASDEHHGLVNRASFLAPGQDVTVTMAGCRGSFVQFTGGHAVAAALEAQEVLEQVLNGQTEGRLVSRYRGQGTANRVGLNVSSRVKVVRKDEINTIEKYSSKYCEVCGCGK